MSASPRDGGLGDSVLRLGTGGHGFSPINVSSFATGGHETAPASISANYYIVY